MTAASRDDRRRRCRVDSASSWTGSPNSSATAALFGGSPARVLRLTPAGQAALADLRDRPSRIRRVRRARAQAHRRRPRAPGAARWPVSSGRSRRYRHRSGARPGRDAGLLPALLPVTGIRSRSSMTARRIPLRSRRSRLVMAPCFAAAPSPAGRPRPGTPGWQASAPSWWRSSTATACRRLAGSGSWPRTWMTR